MNEAFIKSCEHYPGLVREYASRVAEALSEDNFFVEEEIDPRIFFVQLCERCMGYFLDGEGLPITDTDMVDVIRLSSAQTILESLKGRGLLDSIEDENGEERFFLTSEGKQVAEGISSRSHIYNSMKNENSDSYTS